MCIRDSVRTEPEALGLPRLTTAAQVPTLGQKQIQAMVNSILEKLIRDTDSNTELVDCKYLQGFSIQLPTWFLQLKGHKFDQKPNDNETSTPSSDGLEVRYREAFPELKSFTSNALNQEILNVVLADYPSLLQSDFEQMFDGLCS